MNFLKYPKGGSLKKKKNHKMETTSQSNQEKTGTNKMEIITETKKTKRRVKDNYTQVYVNKPDNLDETDNFLGKYNF